MEEAGEFRRLESTGLINSHDLASLPTGQEARKTPTESWINSSNVLFFAMFRHVSRCSRTPRSIDYDNDHPVAKVAAYQIFGPFSLPRWENIWLGVSFVFLIYFPSYGPFAVCFFGFSVAFAYTNFPVHMVACCVVYRYMYVLHDAVARYTFRSVSLALYHKRFRAFYVPFNVSLCIILWNNLSKMGGLVRMGHS